MSGRKNKVVYVRPEEPAFLRKIKAKIGYQEAPSVDTKVNTLYCLILVNMIYLVFLFLERRLGKS
jgi:hypothetical protein